MKDSINKCYIIVLALMYLTHAEESKNTLSQDQTSQGTKEVTHRLNAVVTTNTKLKTYQSGSRLNKSVLDSNPSGNGDITSILKILPNVQFDNAQLKSTTPGEIDPANISISGGLFYQNNFQLDGFNMNNDLDPNGDTKDGPYTIRGGRSQGLAVDTSLLESIQVQDSNISAAYGGFTGGVVEANVRKPRRDKGGLFGWHGNINYQFTGDKFTQYHIDPSQEDNFIASANEYYQPHFTKHLIRANIEGYATQDLGIIASFSTTRSFIPLNAYSSAFTSGTEAGSKREQHRYIDNYYVKANYNPTENLTLEANLAYMPQDNTYYNIVAKDSFYSMKSGGIQSGIKALYDMDMGLWTNTISYSWMQNSKKSEKNYFMPWRGSDDKNWAINQVNVASEGGYGDIEQGQHVFNYKSDMNFKPLEYEFMSNVFRIGFEANYTNASYNRLNNMYIFLAPVGIESNIICGQDSMFDFETCSNSKPFKPWQNNGAQTGQYGQYFNQVRETKAGKLELNNFAYSIYAEDAIKFDLYAWGMLNARLGFRVDGDTYMQKHTFAPRFSMNYTAPWESYKTEAIFGANRYYGRNLLSYRLYDFFQNNYDVYIRNDPNQAWQLDKKNQGTASYAFNQLNVPYADEFMMGLTQNLVWFDMIIKYIYRGGKDEVMQKRGADKLAPTTWSNDGKSESHVVTLSLQNTKPLETIGIKNYILFAFDWTKVSRSYNLYNVDDAYINNDDIIYDGHFIKYQNRPPQNFARPYTFRLSTIHTFEIWKTKWIVNNFFRYRGAYDAMVLLNAKSPGYKPEYSTIKQYGKLHFDGAFTWDMRIGFEVNVHKGNILFMNLDIYNVLDAQNKIALGGLNGAVSPGIPSDTQVAAYEIGRQFWIQGGYKF